MLKIIKNLSFIFLILILASCASSGKKETEALLQYVRTGDYTSASNYVLRKDFYPQEQSRLLKLMELSRVNFLNENFHQALLYLDAAKELSDKLFTVRISKKLLTAIANDNADNYYGHRHELSMIRFYQIMAHLSLYQQGFYEDEKIYDEKFEKVVKEVPRVELSDAQKRNHLFAARAVMLEWNSKLDSYKAKDAGEDTYKDDLSAKLLGAFIHEKLGSASELQTAKLLYLEAKKVLLRYYSSYPIFNSKSQEFRKNYADFLKLGEEKVEKEFILKTSYHKQLLAFIDERLEDLQKKKEKNLTLFLATGPIAAKTTDTFAYPLNVSMIAFAAISGARTPWEFTIRMLNVTPGLGPVINIEFPKVLKKPTFTLNKIIVKEKNSLKVIAEKELALINPLSELLSESWEQEKTAVLLKTGTRVVAKHMVALGTAYAIYARSKNESLGFFLAGASYMAAAVGIAASEKADVRYWSTLPHNQFMTAFDLPTGEYEFYLERSMGPTDPTKLVTRLGTKLINHSKSSFVQYSVFDDR